MRIAIKSILMGKIWVTCTGTPSMGLPLYEDFCPSVQNSAELVTLKYPSVNLVAGEVKTLSVPSGNDPKMQGLW